MHCMKGVYVLSFNDVSRKIRISHNQIITGECPSSEFGIAVRPKRGAGFSFYPFPRGRMLVLFDTVALSLHHVLFAAAFFFTLFKFIYLLLRFKREEKRGYYRNRDQTG